MKLTIDLDAQCVTTTPPPAQLQAGQFALIEMKFTRANQVVTFPEGTTVELAVRPADISRPSGTPLITYTNLFNPGSNGIYTGMLHVAAAAFYEAHGCRNRETADSLPPLDAFGEITWGLGSQPAVTAVFPLQIVSPESGTSNLLEHLRATPQHAGVVALATQAEVNAGVDNTKALTPSTFAHAMKWGALATSDGHSANVHIVSDRFDADHAGWCVGDIVLEQPEDSASQAFYLAINIDQLTNEKGYLLINSSDVANDSSGDRPPSDLSQMVHVCDDRLAANHAGWLEGDIIIQKGREAISNKFRIKFPGAPDRSGWSGSSILRAKQRDGTNCSYTVYVCGTQAMTPLQMAQSAGQAITQYYYGSGSDYSANEDGTLVIAPACVDYALAGYGNPVDSLWLEWNYTKSGQDPDTGTIPGKYVANESAIPSGYFKVVDVTKLNTPQGYVEITSGL